MKSSKTVNRVEAKYVAIGLFTTDLLCVLIDVFDELKFRENNKKF